MPVNDAALRLITEFEGFVDHWYPDTAHGWKVPTVGYGHTDAAGPPLYADTKGKTFTKAEAAEMLRRDLGQYEDAVKRVVKVPLNANQYGALVSFTYNLGEDNLAKSTLVKKLNAGDYEAASREFAKWNKAGGKVLAGLTRRREAERQLFVAPSAKPSAKPSVNPSPMPEAEPTKSTRSLGLVGWAIIAILVIVAVGYVITRPIAGV